jgi:hypothetical protein
MAIYIARDEAVSRDKRESLIRARTIMVTPATNTHITKAEAIDGHPSPAGNSKDLPIFPRKYHQKCVS